jgi:hypothetical protein
VKPLFACLLLVGCATMEPYPIKTGVDTVTVQLIRADDAQLTCTKMSGASIGQHIEACALPSITHCTIYMLPNASNDLLGHETRHCFDGAWHR